MLKATSSIVNVSQITGVLPVVNGGTGVTTSTGTGSTVLSAAPTLSGNVTLSTGNLIVASGQGIDFSATPGTGTSELLNDYEEGTWTPIIHSGVTDATMDGDNSGRYTKVGRAVHIQAFVATSSITGIGGGEISIKGLPFTVPVLYSAYGGVTAAWGGNLNITAGQSIGFVPSAGTATLNIKIWNVTTGSSTMAGTEWSDDGFVAFSLTYFV